MKKKEIKEKVIDKAIDDLVAESITEPSIKLITEVFGNGDLNMLKDKINEIATYINS